jgi:hypothetical protein
VYVKKVNALVTVHLLISHYFTRIKRYWSIIRKYSENKRMKPNQWYGIFHRAENKLNQKRATFSLQKPLVFSYFTIMELAPFRNRLFICYLIVCCLVMLPLIKDPARVESSGHQKNFNVCIEIKSLSFYILITNTDELSCYYLHYYKTSGQ